MEYLNDEELCRMLTLKQNFLETLKKDGKPDRWVNMYEPLHLVYTEPILRYTFGHRAPGTTSKDRFGVTISWPEGHPAATPHITPENKVLPDITEWKKYVKFPDLATACADGWEEAQAEIAALDKDQYLSTVFMPTGLFEQSHFLMGFEDALCNLLEEPDDMHDLLRAILEYRLGYAKMLVEKLRPDAVLSHDDWGSKHSLFMSPDVWREFFKPLYKEFYAYFKSEGVITIHHSDSFCEPIVADMAEIGIDIWQGVLPQNDIPKIQSVLDGSMTLMGGIDTSLVDRKDSPEDLIRAEARRACKEYGCKPNFIPCFTYGGPYDLIYPHVNGILYDEINRCNAEFYPSV